MSTQVQNLAPGIVRTRPVRVFMMDLLSIVPYYTGHLCAALAEMENLRVKLGSITYHLDRDFFRRQNLQTNPGLLDVVSRVSFGSTSVRRSLKVGECLINMAALLIAFPILKPDVIHVQFLPLAKFGFPLELWFLRMTRSLGIKIVYTVHNVLPQDTGERHRARYQEIYNLADRLICHDTCARDRLVKEFRVSIHNISIIPHGPLFGPSAHAAPEQVRNRCGIQATDCLVLWQGIVRPYKGVSFLLKAWKRMAKEGMPACLVIVGNGDEEILMSVRRQVQSLGIESSVKLELRFVPLTELASFYSAADILVYPYSEITTSGALMTGLGYGKAMIATRLPAFERLLQDQHNVLFVDYGDVDALASKLTQLIREPDLRRRLGEHARQSHVDGPQWHDIARQTLQCYESAIADE